MRSRMTICSGVSNGSAALATIRAFPASSEKRTVKIGVGLLPYVWIGSVWQKRRPVITNLSAYRGRVSIDATSLRMVALGMATSRDNAIPRSSYLFGASWPNVCRTLLVAVEQDGDPYAVMVPTAEIIRFITAHPRGSLKRSFGASTIICSTQTESKPLREFRLHRQEKFLYICGLLDMWEWELSNTSRCRCTCATSLAHASIGRSTARVRSCVRPPVSPAMH